MVRRHGLDPFFRSVLKLKSVKRAGWVSKVKVESAESVADHSFAMCAVAMLFSDMLGLDTSRVMKMVVLHDLAESVVGDYIPGAVPSAEKVSLEKKAMQGILASLPAKARSEYAEIWAEYLGNRTRAARFVHRIDKFEMALQAGDYAMRGYDKSLLAQFFRSAKAEIEDGTNDIVTRTFRQIASDHL